MSIIIAKPGGVTMSKEDLNPLFQKNNNGASFSIADGDTVTRSKVYKKLGALHEAYLCESDNHKYSALIYMRKRTKKSTDPRKDLNMDPVILCSGEYALAHLGGCIRLHTETEAQTRKAIVDWFEPILENGDYAFKQATFRRYTSFAIPNMAIVIMDVNGNFHFINESKGKQIHGAWVCELVNDTFVSPQNTKALRLQASSPPEPPDPIRDSAERSLLHLSSSSCKVCGQSIEDTLFNLINNVCTRHARA